MQIRLLLLLAALLPLPASAINFDYARTQYIYALTETEVIAYGKFPMFLAFRELITKKMADAQAGKSVSSPALYTFRLVGVAEVGELQVGSNWMSDGMRVASLSDKDFQWIKSAVAHREGTGGPAERLEHMIQYDLAQQDDPAWKPDVW